jgi:hypothetical protein
MSKWHWNNAIDEALKVLDDELEVIEKLISNEDNFAIWVVFRSILCRMRNEIERKAK